MKNKMENITKTTTNGPSIAITVVMVARLWARNIASCTYKSNFIVFIYCKQQIVQNVP